MTNRCHVKVCGITRLQDALLCAELGVDMLGFNFFKMSPRSISIEECAAITDQLRAHAPITRLIGIFVNMPVEDIANTIIASGLHAAQLHGDETVEQANILASKFAINAYKAFRGLPLQVDHAAYPQPADLSLPQLLADAGVNGQFGGTGSKLDWIQASSQLPLGKRVLLAGGITPLNAGQAITQVKPWGIDLASGVESAPGIKDETLLRQLMAAVQNINQETEDNRP